MQKIVITSEYFFPSIGGVQNIVAILAKEFARLGYHVTVLTSQQDAIADSDDYKVVHKSSWFSPWRTIKSANAVVHFGGLRLGWPGCLLSQRMLRVRQIWPATKNKIGILAEKLLSRRCIEVAPSVEVGRAFSKRFFTIPNPYDARVFRKIPSSLRDRDLIFVGRLIHEKGVDLILNALIILQDRGLKPNLSIVGLGKELEDLQAQVETLRLDGQVTFRGPLVGEDLVCELNRHQILVVPSRWKEPFGIVALEGIACGCTVIGSIGGGLPDAIGKCGLLFENDNAGQLADRLETLLCQPQLRLQLLSYSPTHLKLHHPLTVARRYLELLQLPTPNTAK